MEGFDERRALQALNRIADALEDISDTLVIVAKHQGVEFDETTKKRD